MASTRLQIRTRLNLELGIRTDSDESQWTLAQRNQAISDAYAELWRRDLWLPAVQDLPTVTDQRVYATTLREIDRIELMDSTGYIFDQVPSTIEPDGIGGYILVIPVPIDPGYTMRCRGWTAHLSTFVDDTTLDDLPDGLARVPILKAKAICYRMALSDFARFGERQVVDPAMNVSVEQMLQMIAACETEFLTEVKAAASRRKRVMRPARVMVT